MIIVWRITGNAIGPNDCGAYYFAKKADAEKIRQNHKNYDGSLPDPPEKIEINTIEEMADALNEAMGYGGT